MAQALASVLARLRAARWDGRFSVEDQDRDEIAADFGHVVRHRPAAVLRASSTDDVATLLRAAAADRIPVTARGMGHSTDGQAQVRDGIVVDMRDMAQIGPVEDDRVTVGAGASWRSVVSAAARHGRTPPVLTDYLGLSVGGTVSVGGIGGTSHRHGLQTDNVTELQVVTCDGVVHTCSPEREPGLFDAVRCGLGQHGIITAATLRLVPAPTRVRRCQLVYADTATLLADQRMLLRSGRFEYLEGEILPAEDGWRHVLDVAAFDSRHEDTELLAGLRHDVESAQIEDVDHVEFADRLAVGEAFLRSIGEWQRPHPWWNGFLPDSATDVFLDRLIAGLTVEDVGGSGLVLCYPMWTDAVRTPLARLPDEPVAFLVGLLRSSVDTPAAARAAAGNVERNRAARSVGGVAYPVSTVGYRHEDWVLHFGPSWPMFAAAKQRFDPSGILCPGQRVVADPAG